MVVKRRKRAAQSNLMFWLIPAGPERELFSALVRTLARGLKAPLFEPHLTLFIKKTSVTEARRVLREIRSAPVRLAISKVDYSARFTKTLFVRFHRNSSLDGLVRKIQRGAGPREARVTDPHLSLCYKKISAPAKRELASIIHFPFKTVTFDMVKVVQSGPRVTTATDVRRWQSLGSRRLAR